MNKITKGSSFPYLYRFLSKYFFLLLGITYLSVVTISAISWGSICSVDKGTNNYSYQSASSEISNQNNILVWFYASLLLGCTTMPWLLAYIFRHRAFLVNKKPLRHYPPLVKVATSQPKQLTRQDLPAAPKVKVTNSHKPIVSYRISSSEVSPPMTTSVSTKTKNVRLPFEGLK